MLIDFHVHLFPDAIAERTLEHLAAIAKMPYHTLGTVQDTLRHMAASGVDMGVVQHIATKPRQQKTINDFAASVQNEKLLCFGTVHPDAEDALDELEIRLRKNHMERYKKYHANG